MLYRKMPKSGDELSVLGYGCMRFPEKGGKIDEERAAVQLRMAIDAGVNYLDTAMPYHMGASEPFLGKVLADGYRDRVKIATKLPHWQVREAGDIRRLFRTQLDNLRTDRIDYYLLHSIDDRSWKKLKEFGIISFIQEEKRAGRIINIGFSFHSSLEAFKFILDDFEWDFCQIQYNYLDEESQAGTAGLEYAASKGLGIIVMEPLRGGSLAGDMPPAIEEIMNRAPVKRPAVEWALRWIWNRPEVTLILSGMNEEEHIEENLRIAGEALPESLLPEELEIVGQVEAKYRELMKVGCTGCRYCMPCPSGVNIPTSFELYNTRHMWGNKQGTFIFYMLMVGQGMSGKKPQYASLCTQCGKCEKACPQDIAIADRLKDVAREFEGPRMTILRWFVKHFFALRRRRDIRRGKRLQRRQDRAESG